jgi:hypothetical protein
MPDNLPQASAAPAAASQTNVREANWLLGLLGAAAGGTLGYFAFFLLARQGFYGLVLPGGLLGLGCGLLSGGKSDALGIVCALLGLMLGLFTEWRFAPFIVNASLSYFITHIQDLNSTTLLLVAAGGGFGYWFGRGRGTGLWTRRPVGPTTSTEEPPPPNFS